MKRAPKSVSEQFDEAAKRAYSQDYCRSVRRLAEQTPDPALAMLLVVSARATDLTDECDRLRADNAKLTREVERLRLRWQR